METRRGAWLALGVAVPLAGVGVLGGAAHGTHEAPAHEAGAPTARRTPTGEAADLLGALTGAPAVACELVVRALGNRWGGGLVQPRVHEPLGAGERERALARWAWTNEPGPGDAPALLDGLSSEDDCVRRVAAALLSRVDDPSTTAALVERVARGEGPARFAAMTALSAHAGSAARDALAARLSDADPGVRRAAAWALGEARAGGEALERALADPDASVRENAAWALGRVGEGRAVSALVRSLGDADPGVRLNAAWALGRFD